IFLIVILRFWSHVNTVVLLMDRMLEKAAAPIVAFGPQTDWRMVLPSLALILIDFIIASVRLHEALFHSAFARNRPEPLHKRLAARLAKILVAGMAAGAYTKRDPESTGALVSAVIHETADQILAGADRGCALKALDHALHRITFSNQG